MPFVICFRIDKWTESMLSITSSQECSISLGKLAIFYRNPKQIATQMLFAFWYWANIQIWPVKSRGQSEDMKFAFFGIIYKHHFPC